MIVHQEHEWGRYDTGNNHLVVEVAVLRCARNASIWVTDFAQGILWLGVSLCTMCTMCTISNVPHLMMISSLLVYAMLFLPSTLTNFWRPDIIFPHTSNTRLCISHDEDVSVGDQSSFRDQPKHDQHPVFECVQHVVLNTLTLGIC